MITLKQILVISLLTISFHSEAQEFIPISYGQIETEVKRKDSPFYYPNLFERYLKGDTTLTLTESRYVYYGFTTMPLYEPYGRFDKVELIHEILGKDSLSQTDYETMLSLTEEGLNKYPFELRLMSYHAWAAGRLGNSELKAAMYNRIDQIFESIISSGDGASTETAFYVIDVAHEYALLEAFGFEYGGQQRLIGGVDELKLAQNEHEIEYLYFNVEASLNHLNEMFSKKEDSDKPAKKKKKK